MKKIKTIKQEKEVLQITIMLIMLIMLMSIIQSCQKQEQNVIVEDEEIEEEDCRYKFDEGLENIYGTWEPKILIDYETGDSIYYEIGEGHQGHMFNSFWYSDSFELRDNGEFKMFYTSSGKPCKDQSSGTWDYEEMIINFYIPNFDTVNLPILEIKENILIIEDEINAKESKVVMRKAS